MPLKALVTTLLTTATTLGTSRDTSIRETDSQLVIVRQLQEIVNQLQGNNKVLKNRINGIRAAKVKLPLIKRFLGKKSKLKGFLIQMHFKVI